jgi:hypothetical protein
VIGVLREEIEDLVYRLFKDLFLAGDNVIIKPNGYHGISPNMK